MLQTNYDPPQKAGTGSVTLPGTGVPGPSSARHTRLLRHLIPRGKLSRSLQEKKENKGGGKWRSGRAFGGRWLSLVARGLLAGDGFKQGNSNECRLFIF